MHVGYALIVAISVFRVARELLVRTLAILYPPFVLVVVVATGNHFFFDAATGAFVAALAMAAAAVLTRRPPATRLSALPAQREQPPRVHELAA
jgi:hypothetical protein